MINQCRAAFAAAGAFVRSTLSHADQGRSVRRTHAGRWPLGVLALGVAPLGMAADLQITDLSDTGYDPAPLGGEVFYSVTLENGAGDTSADAVSIFDLPAGTVAGTLPGFCSVDGAVPTRIVCLHGPLQGTQGSGGGSPVTFLIGVDTTTAAAGTVELRSAIGYQAALPPASTPISALGVGHVFFSGDTNTGNNVRSQATTLVVAGNLRLQKSATPDPVVGGSVVTYTLTVTNQGPSASTHFAVVDTLPDHVAYVADSFSGAGFTFDAGTMTATFPGTLQPN